MYQVWTHSFFSYASDVSVKNALIEPATYWHLNTKTIVGYPKVIPNTKFEHFWIIRFWVMLRRNNQSIKQTNKQTDSKILPTPIDVACEADKKLLFMFYGVTLWNILQQML